MQDMTIVDRGPRAATGASPQPAPVARPDQPLLERVRLTGEWWGARPWLDDRGLTFSGSLLTEVSGAVSGGLRNAVSARSLVSVIARFDLARMIGLDGAVVLADFTQKAGRNGTDDVGAFQKVSSADATNFAALYELWWQQTLFDGLFRIKAGKVDVNTEFAFSEHAAGFVNANFGAKTTLFLAPSYPDPATSVNVFLYPTSWLYFGGAIYDGSAAVGVRTGPRGPDSFFNNGGDWFLIGEVGATWGGQDDGLPGRLALGGLWHTSEFERFDGRRQTGAGGLYLMFDHALFRPAPDAPDDLRGLFGFLMLGFADPRVSAVRSHVGAGLVAVGLLPARPRDALGVAVSWDRFTGDDPAAFPRGNETVFEAYYDLRVTPWFVLKPDVQFIMNPGAGDTPNAVVLSLRAEITF